MFQSTLRALLISVVFPAVALAEPLSIPLHDGESAAANVKLVDGGSKAALLLHQCNRDQRMWAPLVATLNERGISTMTVDLRGYGQSASAKYNVREHGFEAVVGSVGQDILSIDSAWRDVTGAAKQRVVIGASCGGGLATRLAIESRDIDGLLIFSPSLRSRWLPESARDNIDEIRQRPILAVVAEGDTAAVDSISLVFDQNAAQRSQKITYKGDQHGEPLFEHDPMLATVMAEWVRRVMEAAD